MPSLPIADCSAFELGRLLRTGELEATELLECFIERIEGSTAVFIATCFDRARREAAESAARHRTRKPLSALDGVPVAWKDLFDVAGTATTAGSLVYRDAAPAKTDAPVVARLAQAGMVTLGKTNLTEFAYSSLGLNPHFGTPHNPCSRDEPRVPGGSSSGSAVAVAAGLVPVAIGTDTGGSVRNPAAFNGLVGFKSSIDRVDTTGVFPLSMSLDTVGVFARCVADCWLLDGAMRGSLPAELPRQDGREVRDTRVVVPASVQDEDMEPQVRANFLESLERLKAAGIRVEWRDVPEIAALHELVARHGNIAAAEAYWLHRDIVEGPRSADVDPNVRTRIMAAKGMPAYDLIALQQGCRRLAHSLWASLDGALLATPTTPHVAPALAAVDADPASFARLNIKTIRFSLPCSMLGSCGVALPNGIGAANMPTSILFSAGPGADERLLQLAMGFSNHLTGEIKR